MCMSESCIFISLIAPAGRQLQRILKEPTYTYFDFSDPDGERLIKLLLDLLKYEDDSIHLNTFRLLFDIYQVRKCPSEHHTEYRL